MSAPRKMIVNAADPEVFRVAIVEEGQMEELALESSSREPTKANIYKGMVANIEPSLQAAFVNYGGERHGFLPLSEVHPDCYQEKPQSKAKTKIQRVLRKGQELIVQVEAEIADVGSALRVDNHVVAMPSGDLAELGMHPDGAVVAPA